MTGSKKLPNEMPEATALGGDGRPSDEQVNGVAGRVTGPR